MSVIVDGMKMPENCESCPCSRDMSAYMDVAEGVAVGCKIRMLISRTGRGTRPAWCPLRPVPEWISVEERLPEVAKKVLLFWCANSEPCIDTGFYTSEGWAATHWELRSEVTHWMPLPEPPVDEKEADQ